MLSILGVLMCVCFHGWCVMVLARRMSSEERKPTENLFVSLKKTSSFRIHIASDHAAGSIAAYHIERMRPCKKASTCPKRSAEV